MTKILTLLLLLGPCLPASAGYDEAAALLKGAADQQSRELDALLAEPGAALVRSEKATALAADNQKALELFRQAAALRSDGYLLSPKPAKLTAASPAPKYANHIKLFKLALLDAKLKLARGQRVQAEEDLLAAAGFIAQLSAQRSFMVLTSMTERLCIQKAFPVLAESLRGKAASESYLEELSVLLTAAAKDQDLMRSAMQEEALMQKNTVQESMTPEKFKLERASLPFWKRYAANRLQDGEFFAMASAKYGAAADACAKALSDAFAANDPAIAENFIARQHEEARAKIAAASNRGMWAELMDGIRGGAEAKARMSDIAAYTMIDITTPAYGKLVPSYHAGQSQLGVLRAALAVKIYQRVKKRLPDSLDQLVPKQLEAVPQDAFNKFAPLAYVRDGKKFSVYGFGPDRKDDKGAAELDMSAYLEDQSKSAGDIVFSD